MNIPEYNGAGIYRINFGNDGKCYIGQSKHVHRRLKEHMSALKNGRHNNEVMQAAYDNGDTFSSEVVEEIAESACSKRYMDNREAHEILNAGESAVNKNHPCLFDLGFFYERTKNAEINIWRALDWVCYCQKTYDIDWRPMDGSETPDITPARRAYNFALAILNNWIEQEEQK